MSKLPAPHLQIHTKSPASIFLTNLRLLNFDKRPDWPSISPQLFLPKDAPKNQKNRIQCVEWALYRLFEKWDLEETKNKLQPYFPPLLPLQSINLRAALFRYLNELKKDGILRKEITIRKTMLDECKGEKFEEVLGAFSTLVLQRVLDAEQNAEHSREPSRTRKLVVAQRLSFGEQQSLLPLAIAHLVSLTTLLRKKERLKAKYLEFQRLLEAKEVELRAKAEFLEASEPSERGQPAENIRRLRDYFGIHWQGDLRWVHTIFGEGKDDTHDSLLDSPFPELWAKVTDSTVEQPAPKQQGLLQQLEERVAVQEGRLQQWKRFREDLAVTAIKVEINAKTKLNHDLGLKFSRHTELDVDANGLAKKDIEDPANHQESIAIIVDEYQKLMNSLRIELGRVDNVKQNKYENPMAISTKETNTDRMSESHTDPGIAKAVTRIPGHSKLKHFPAKENSRIEEIDSNHAVKLEQHPDQETNLSKKSRPLPSKSESMQPPNQYRAPRIEADEEDILAQQIISSTLNAVSPIKPKLSLVERTRRSMALKIPGELSQLTESVPVASSSIDSGGEFTVSSSDAPTQRRETLLERTRQSMSLLPPKPHKKPEQRRASKVYPTNQFGTPEKGPRTSNAEVSTPPEALFGQDVNYASVFKSRPKVALSPILTPMVQDGFHDLDDIMEGQLLEDGFGGNSPLTRATERVRRF